MSLAAFAQQLKTNVSHNIFPTVIANDSACVESIQRYLATKVPFGVTVCTLQNWLTEQWFLYGDGRTLQNRSARAYAFAREYEEIVEDARMKAKVKPRPKSAAFFEMISSIANATEEEMHVIEQAIEPSNPFNLSKAEREVCQATVEYTRRMSKANVIEPKQAAVELAKRATDVPCLGPLYLFGIDFLERPYKQLFAALKEQGHSIEAVQFELFEPKDRNSELVQLCSHLYGSKRGTLEAKGALRIAKSSGLLSPSVLIACEVASAVERGIEPQEIAIVIPTQRTHLEAAIQEELLHKGFSVTNRIVHELVNEPFAQAFRLLLTAASYGRREDIVAFFATPYSDVRGKGAYDFDVAVRQKVGFQALGCQDFAAEESKAFKRLLPLAYMIMESHTKEESVAAFQTITEIMLSNIKDARKRARDERIAARIEKRLRAASYSSAISAQAKIDLLFTSQPYGMLTTTVPSNADAIEDTASVGVSLVDKRSLACDVYRMIVVTAFDNDSYKTTCDDNTAVALQRKLGIADVQPYAEKSRAEFKRILEHAQDLVVLHQPLAVQGDDKHVTSILLDEVTSLYVDVCAIPNSELTDAPIENTAPANSLEQRELRAKAAGHAEVVGRRSPLVLSDYGKARLGERTHVGSTAIEKYISCRYQWFYDSVLNPEDIDSEAAEIGAGIYAHAVMQEFYTNFSALHPEGCHVTEANFEEAQQVFNDALEKQTDIFLALANHSDPFESMKYFRTQKQLQEFLNSEIGFLPFFQPTHFEYEVGSDEDKKYGRAGITLRGRADCVDMAEDGSFVIVDYKSGNVYPWSNPVGIKKTQAALYAILLKKFGEGRPVGAVYRSFKNAKASGAINTSNQDVARDDNAIEDGAKFPVSQNDKRARELQISSFDDFLGYIEFRLARALDEMAAGNITPSISDGDKSACRYCSAKSFCREGVGYEH